MNCTLVYALVPNEPLEHMVDHQAYEAAKKKLQPVLQSMALEDQSPNRQQAKAMLHKLAQEIAEQGGQRLWGNE